MALPVVTITRVNGTFAPVIGPPSKALVIGPASSGSVLTKYTFGQPSSPFNTLGYGPAPTLAALLLADNGGSCDVLVATASITGKISTGSIGGSAGLPLVTIGGAPYDTYDVRFQVVGGGALGVATFQYSLDGNQTVSPPLLASGSVVLTNTGLVLSFSAGGGFTGGTTATFSTQAPQMSAADLTNAINCYTGSIVAPTVLMVANDTQSATSGSALFASLNSGLTTLNLAQIPTVAMMPAGGTDGGTSATIAAFASSAASVGNIIAVGAERGRCLLPVPFMGYSNPRLPFSYAVCSRLQGIVLSTNPARVGDGALARWSDVTYDEFVNGQVYQDQNIQAPRTWKNFPGVFLQQSVLKSQTGSSYVRMEQCRVFNRADQVARQALSQFINSAVRVKKDGTGYIDSRDADHIEGVVQSALTTAIMQPMTAEGNQGFASGIQFAIDRATNVLTSNTVYGVLSIIPLANIDQIQVQMSFAVSFN